MIIEYAYAQRYLFSALQNGPLVLERLMSGVTNEEADFRPDPERFTLREIVAHMADFDPVFRRRMERVCEEEIPTMEGYDEGELAIQNDYASKDVAEQTRLFLAEREKMITYLATRRPEDWQRLGDRPEIGLVTLEGLALLIPLHDLYHIEQIQDYRQQWKARTTP